MLFLGRGRQQAAAQIEDNFAAAFGRVTGADGPATGRANMANQRQTEAVGAPRADEKAVKYPFLITFGLNPIKINGDTFILTSILDITERIKMEETQKQSAFRLELATRAGGVGLWEYDIVNNRIVWDEQMYVLYGTTKETKKKRNPQ